MNPDPASTDDLLDKLYAVALEPERFSELMDTWRAALDGSGVVEPVLSNWRTALLQHLSRADAILTIAEQQTEGLPETLRQHLDAEAQAMLAVDGDGVIRALNSAARLRYGLDAGGRIDALPVHPAGLDELRGSLARLLRAGRQRPPPALLRLPRREAPGSLFVAATRWQAADGSRLALLKTTDFAWPDALTPLVAEAFGLTDAEAEVVRLIVEGASVEAVAAARHRTVATVRSQIRSIYAKTATRSQAEFIRLAVGLTTLQLALLDQSPPAAGDRAFVPLPEHRRLFQLPDGRQLDYAEFGAADGLPCVYFDNPICGDSWPAAFAEAVSTSGLRFIAPARAGYGRSSLYPPGVLNVTQTSADVLSLLDHLGIGRFLAASQAIGLMFATVLARDAGGRCVAQVSVSPAFPEEETRLPSFFRFTNSIVSRHPELLEFVARAGTAYARRKGWARFLELMLRHSPMDLAIVQDPANAPVLERTWAYAFRHGHRAVLGDAPRVPDAWGVLASAGQPIYALIGSADRPGRLDSARRLRAAGAPIRIVVVEGGGQLLGFSHPTRVAELLAQAWAEAGSAATPAVRLPSAVPDGQE